MGTHGATFSQTAGNLFKIEGGVVACGNKSVTFSQRMVNVETSETHASQSVTEVFFDPKTRTAAQIPGDLKEKVDPFLILECLQLQKVSLSLTICVIFQLYHW